MKTSDIERAFVTGANGHVGANLVRRLLARGVEVRALVRPGSDRRGLAGLDAELVEGDVLEPESFARAMEGCDVVFHLAAAFAIWARDPSEILRPSIEGTENVLRAAAAAGARRVVMVSSVAAAGASDDPERVLGPDDWAEGLTVPYYQAKQRAERRAWQLADELDLELVTLLPTLVLGPWDYRVTPSSRLVLDMLRGEGMTVPGGMNLVHVDDVALALVRAAERGHPGARYIVGGENLENREVGRIVEDLTGRPVKHAKLPRWVAYVAAALMESGAAITGRPPPLTRAAVHDVLGKYAWYDTSSTRAVLGIEPRSAEQILRDTATWFDVPIVDRAARAA